MRARHLLSIALVVVCVSGSASRGNDSTVELAVGGLNFTKSSDVSIESEDLSIDPRKIDVKYRFLNQGAAPVTLTIGFPLPEIDLSDPDLNYAFPANHSENFVGFRTQIDGKPVSFQVQQRALLGQKDVTQMVKSAGLPVLLIAGNALKSLDPVKAKALLDAGLLVLAGNDAEGKPLLQPGWSVRTVYVRKQTFPPGKEVIVEHQYKTSVGTSPDTILRRAVRESLGMRAELAKYQADYCLSPEFLNNIDTFAGKEAANVNKVREQRISYVLKTGANWAGPIKSFRLRIDPGGPGKLISFCASGETRLLGQSIEVHAKDFLPQKDLKILIISKG